MTRPLAAQFRDIVDSWSRRGVVAAHSPHNDHVALYFFQKQLLC